MQMGNTDYGPFQEAEKGLFRKIRSGLKTRMDTEYPDVPRPGWLRTPHPPGYR